MSATAPTRPARRGGTDTVSSSISYVLAANLENLILTGTAFLGGGNGLDNAITGNNSDNRLDGGAGADLMKGVLGNDIYVIDNVGDVADETGGAGIDTVAERDHLHAGRGRSRTSP